MKYKKKPITVKAFKIGYEKAPNWFVENENCIPFWDAVIPGVNTIQPLNAKIHTPEGVMQADKGDYIIQGINGEVYPCKPDIFNKTYDKVNDND